MPIKYVFDSCKKKTDCKQCDLGYILKNYIKPIIQCLTNDIKEYYMKLSTTKCLNHAVMLSIFMLGKKKGLELANYCDVPNTIERHNKSIVTNEGIITKYTRDILNVNCKYRYLYYILLTDGYFPYNNEKPKFFPGHVFIFEKIPQINEKPYYNFYQSYINYYDLKEHIKKNGGTLQISYERAHEILNNLMYIMNSNTWDEECISKWHNFTFADSSYLKDSICKNKFFICVRKARIIDCLKHIEKFTLDKIKYIEPMLTSKKNMIYGTESLYDDKQNPLTVKQMYKEMNKLYRDIQKNVR